MKAKGVDFILCPAYVGAGVLQGGAKYWNYTAIWNILDQPASILPSGLRVDKNIDKPEEAYTPRNQQDEEEWKACKLIPPLDHSKHEESSVMLIIGFKTIRMFLMALQCVCRLRANILKMRKCCRQHG